MEIQEIITQNGVNIKESKNFEILSDKNRIFIVSIINNLDSLIISAFIKDDYSIDYKFEDNLLFKKIKMFKYFTKSNSLEDILEKLFSLIVDKKAFIIEQNENIYLQFQFALKNKSEIGFLLKKKKLCEKEIINLQNLKIAKLEKELKEIKEKYDNLLKQQNMEIEEKEQTLDNEVFIKYYIFDQDYSIKCNKFIKISQFKKILQDKHLLNTELMLIFCGIEMDDNILLNDFPLQEYGEEKIYIRDLSYKLYASNQTKIINENTEVVFYGVKTFELLKKYVNIYFNNEIIFYDLRDEMVP